MEIEEFFASDWIRTSNTVLNGPCNPFALLEIKSIFKDFPENLEKILKRFDGESEVARSSIFPNGFKLMTCAHILEYLRYIDSRVEDTGEVGVDALIYGPVKRLFFDKLRLPFAHQDAKVYLLIDFNPPLGGTFGQVVLEDVEDVRLSVLSQSLESFVERLAKDVKNGIVFLDSRGRAVTKSGVWPTH
jgi:cell wall assembly regulator SMI1